MEEQPEDHPPRPHLLSSPSFTLSHGTATCAFPMSPSRSAPDITSSVANLVDRFTTLEVKDRDEEKTSKQMKRLEAALRRAEIAREEAETEAKKLRAEVRDLHEIGEEWVAEKQNLKARSDEFEKKYEKAKAHFRAQRTKHDEATRKTAKEVMEREKQHWRTQAASAEELEWERRLRVEAYELVAFLEIERQMTRKAADRQPVTAKHDRPKSPIRADSAVDRWMADDENATNETQDDGLRNTTQHSTAASQNGHDEATHSPQENLQSQHDYALQYDITPEPEVLPSLVLPKKQPLTIPINFGDQDPQDQEDNESHNSDKENTMPSLHINTPVRRPASALATSCHRTPPATISTSTIPLTGAPRTPSLHNRAHSAHAGTQKPLVSDWRRDDDPKPDDWNIPGVLASADLDRAAALAAIRSRRSRARSVMESSNGHNSSGSAAVPSTPGAWKSQEGRDRDRSLGRAGPKTPATERPQVASRRDVSAAVGVSGLGSLSVGRVRAARS